MSDLLLVFLHIWPKQSIKLKELKKFPKEPGTPFDIIQEQIGYPRKYLTPFQLVELVIELISQVILVVGQLQFSDTLVDFEYEDHIFLFSL